MRRSRAQITDSNREDRHDGEAGGAEFSALAASVPLFLLVFPDDGAEFSAAAPDGEAGAGRDLKEALLDAAQEVGEVEETEILDKDGKPTGQFRRKATGKGGLKGYLKWAAVYRANAFIPQLGRVMPTQINVKAEAPKRVVYPSLEDSRAALRARGIDPDVIEKAMMPDFITDQRPVIEGEVEDDAKPN